MEESLFDLEQPIPVYSRTASSIDDKTAKDLIGHSLPIILDSLSNCLHSSVPQTVV